MALPTRGTFRGARDARDAVLSGRCCGGQAVRIREIFAADRPRSSSPPLFSRVCGIDLQGEHSIRELFEEEYCAFGNLRREINRTHEDRVYKLRDLDKQYIPKFCIHHGDGNMDELSPGTTTIDPAADAPSIQQAAATEQPALQSATAENGSTLPADRTTTTTAPAPHDENEPTLDIAATDDNGDAHITEATPDNVNGTMALHPDVIKGLQQMFPLGAPFELVPPPHNSAPIMLPEDADFVKPEPTDDDVRQYNSQEAENELAELRAKGPREQPMSAFARLKFCDGSYYMHTYQIVLGRNVELAREDIKRLSEQEQRKKNGDIRRPKRKNEALGRKKRRSNGPSAARSVVSETGGIVSAPLAALPFDYQVRKHSEASQSISSSSHHQSHENSSGQHEDRYDHAPQDVIMQAFPPVPQNIDAVVPEDPNDCPHVPIHPQNITAKRGPKGPKGISREHAKIFYNFQEARFELEVLSSLGLWHDGLFHNQTECIPLQHGDEIQIGAVEIEFLLPDVALTDEQRARQESSSRPMSFSFENGRGESEDLIDSTGSEHESVNPRHLFHYANGYDDSDEGIEDEDEVDQKSSPEILPKKQTVRLKLKRPQPEEPPAPTKKHKEKRRAAPELPEEPQATKMPAKPKQKEVVKEKSKEKRKAPVEEPAKETPQEKPTESPETPVKEEPGKKPAAQPKARPTETSGESDRFTAEEVASLGLPDSMVGEIKPKRKGPGRPPKDGIMSKRQKALIQREFKEAEKARKLGLDPSEVHPSLTKAKPPRPRKESTAGEEGDIRESTEGGEFGFDQMGEKKSKSSKPARSPSPEMKESDFTEDQLQRPAANYVVLIHEAISNSPTGQMNLQQIYSAIERKYPWFKFRVTTQGWQSSVRHNLGQHEAFKKADKEGKGYNWVIDPNVSIEKEKRKRQPTPPPSQTQTQNQNQRQQGYYPPPQQYGAPYGQPSGHYQGYYPPPQNASANARTATPDNPPAPRLPPSLARSAPANTPTTQPGNSHASPYASPWAGGNNGAQNQQPPRPYPPPSAYSQPPATAHPSPYGMLVATPYTTASPYNSAYVATTSGPSYSTGPSYSPYTSASPYAQPPPATAPPPYQPAKFPYPPHIRSDLIPPLEAFRSTLIQLTPEDKPAMEQKVNNAIRAIVAHPSDPAIQLSPDEQSLADVIRQKVPGVRDLQPPRFSKQEQTGTASTQEKIENEELGVTNEAEKAIVLQEGPPPGKTLAEISNAATAAASNAAVTAAVVAVGGVPPPPPSIGATQAQMKSEPLPETRPNSSHTTTGRPSVEPLTPVPGSPAPMRAGTKRGFEEISQEEDDDGGAEEEREGKKIAT